MKVFVLSPARAGGRRAQLLTRPEATFQLARQLQIGAAALGDVFAFCSGLYFRGKLTYAQRFAHPVAGVAGVQIITPSRGLLSADTHVGSAELHEFSTVDVGANEPRFTEPLLRSVEILAAASCEVVLLGSVATGKYVDCLLPVLGNRLLFPSTFVGRGDMSRGGLLLRSAARSEELDYLPVSGAIRRGPRAAKLSTCAKEDRPKSDSALSQNDLEGVHPSAHPFGHHALASQPEFRPRQRPSHAGKGCARH